MLDGFKDWFNKLDGWLKFVVVAIIVIIVVAIIVIIVLLITKIGKKQENFSFSDTSKQQNQTDVGSIAEAYTAAWIASLKS